MKLTDNCFCKTCGIVIKNSSIKQKNRTYCKYCFKDETKRVWEFKKDIINPKRKVIRRLPREKKKCICCNKEFETARKQQVTCGDIKCQKAMKNAKNRINLKENRKFYTRNCTICNAEFTTTQPKKLNCSEKCVREYQILRPWLKNKEKGII